MPALALQQGAPADTWRAAGPVNAATVYTVAPIPLPWATGAPGLLARHTPARTLPGAALSVDMTGGPWLIVAVQGLSYAYLVPEVQEANLDAIVGAAGTGTNWNVLRRHFRLYSIDWQQVTGTF